MSQQLDYEDLAEKNCKCVDDTPCAWCVAENAKEQARWAGYLARGWKEEKCGSCRGFGVVSDYGAMGTDFYGAKDCDGCGGQGRVWRTPSGKHAALWPGGPFVE